MPDDIILLWLLRIIAGLAALVYGLIATFTDLREERDGVRRLTTKGKAGLAVALVAFVLSISADVLKDGKEDRARAQAEAEFRARSDTLMGAQVALLSQSDSMTAQQSALMSQILSVRDYNVATLEMQRTALGQLTSVLDTSRSVSQQQAHILSNLGTSLTLSTRMVEGLDSTRKAIDTTRDAMVASVERGTNPVTQVAMQASLILDPGDAFLSSFAQRAHVYRDNPSHPEKAPFGFAIARILFWRSEGGCTDIPERALLAAAGGFVMREQADSIWASWGGVMSITGGGSVPLGQGVITRNSISLQVDTLRLLPHPGIAVQDLRGACVAVHFSFPEVVEKLVPLALHDLNVAWEKAAVEFGPLDLAPQWQAPCVRLVYSESTKWWVGRMASEFVQVQKEFTLNE